MGFNSGFKGLKWHSACVIYEVLMNAVLRHQVYSETARRFKSNVCVLCHEIHHLLSTSNINVSKANITAYLIVFEVAHVQGCESQSYDGSPPI